MKKLSLEMLRLTSDEVLGRSQMKKITGGYQGAWVCTCSGQAPVTVWDGNSANEYCDIVFGTWGYCTPADMWFGPYA